MKVWNADEATIREALASVGLQPYQDWSRGGITPDGRALRFRLALDTSQDRDGAGFLPYQRCSTWRETNGKPRRVAAVCWHGHRDMMRALFRLAPDARIKTALADYRGAADFERQYSATYGEGNGWNVSYGQACGCGADVREGWE